MTLNDLLEMVCVSNVFVDGGTVIGPNLLTTLSVHIPSLIFVRNQLCEFLFVSQLTTYHAHCIQKVLWGLLLQCDER